MITVVDPSSLEPAEVVTLDRVVCGYEDYRALLTAVQLENALRRLRGNSFRNFVHPTADIHRLITDAGFQRVDERLTATWAVEVYARQSA